jgi:hypothetical protein
VKLPTRLQLDHAFALALKGLNQWLDGPDDRVPRAAFVFGCQRSGTTMTSDVLERSPNVWVHREKSGLAYRDFRLRSPAVTHLALRLSPAEVVVFKPLCDSHLADRILDTHDGAVGLWVTRHWGAVARSAVAKWGPHQADVIRAIAADRAPEVGWRGERLPPGMVEQLRGLVTPDLSPEAGAALFWYLRNTFLFALGLDTDSRVRIVRYEDLVRDPEAGFATVLEHLGVPFDPAIVDDVRVDASPPTPADVPPPIARLCDALQARLDALHARQADGSAKG